eukprot:2431312-Amphidinium_carterae.1
MNAIGVRRALAREPCALSHIGTAVVSMEQRQPKAMADSSTNSPIRKPNTVRSNEPHETELVPVGVWGLFLGKLHSSP